MNPRFLSYICSTLLSIVIGCVSFPVLAGEIHGDPKLLGDTDQILQNVVQGLPDYTAVAIGEEGAKTALASKRISQVFVLGMPSLKSKIDPLEITASWHNKSLFFLYVDPDPCDLARVGFMALGEKVKFALAFSDSGRRVATPECQIDLIQLSPGREFKDIGFLMTRYDGLLLLVDDPFFDTDTVPTVLKAFYRRRKIILSDSVGVINAGAYAGLHQTSTSYLKEALSWLRAGQIKPSSRYRAPGEIVTNVWSARLLGLPILGQPLGMEEYK